MTENEFYSTVAKKIIDFFPESYKDAEVIIEERVKDNNVVVHGMTLRQEGVTTSPLLYLDEFYLRAKNHEPLRPILRDISNKYLLAELDAKKIEVPDMSSETLMEKVRCRVIDARANEKLVQSLVHQDLGCGYAMILYRETKLGDKTGMVQITHEIAEMAGLSEKELLERALSNTEKAEKATFMEVTKVLFGPSDKPQYLSDEPYIDPDSNLIVLTNDAEPPVYGSTVFFYPETQEKVAEVLGCSYYVLPSSVHEVLIVPVREEQMGGMDKESMVHMVKDINEMQVAPQERFGNRVLFYDKDTKELSIAAELDRPRTKERER